MSTKVSILCSMTEFNRVVSGLCFVMTMWTALMAVMRTSATPGMILTGQRSVISSSASECQSVWLELSYS